MSGKNKNILITLILGALTTVSPFSIDLYLPAFKKIAEHFGTTPSRVSFTLSSYFIGLAIGQIFYGPFLDRFGRKRPLYFGLLLYIVASVGCAFSVSIEMLIVMRFLQAIGGCAASVAATAMVRDFFSPEEGAKVFSRLMLILSVSPLFAPTVGGWVISLFGWQMLFFILSVIVSMFLLIVFLFLPEGHQPDPSVHIKLMPMIRTFSSVLTNRQFFTYTFSGAFSFAGLFTYLAGAPAIFLDSFQLSANMFGLLFACLSVGMIGGGQFNIFLQKFFKAEKIFSRALEMQLLMAIIFVVGCAFDWYGLKSQIAIFFIYISCVGLTYPNAAALAMAPFSKNAGSASALLGTVQMGVGAAAATAFGLLKDLTPSLAVAVVFLFTSMIALTIFNIARVKQSTLPNSKIAQPPGGLSH